MTAPNEPGNHEPGESTGNGDGPADSGNARRTSPQRGGPQSGGGRITHTGETPPWQRGTQGPRPPSQRGSEGHDLQSGGHSTGMEARMNRFVSGSGAPATPAKASVPESEATRTDGRRSDAYESELPDLSGPARRPAVGKQPARGRGTEPATASSGRAKPLEQAGGHGDARGPVRASMQLRRIDPWSALKVSVVLSVALFFVWMIAVALLYLLLGSMGVWTKLNSNVGDLLTEANAGGGGDLVSASSVFGGATLIGLVNIVVMSALGTVGALVYNVTTELIGGVEVTLADRD